MKIIGIVVEYNPFHKGHLHQIQELKSKHSPDGIIVVMSGHFVQRGEPALLDKWTRAKFALECGVDLVIELPTYYATASAETFARAGVKTLIDTGIVTHICFGSESDNLDHMIEISRVLNDEPPAYKDALSRELAKGLVYPKARENALGQTMPQGQDTQFNLNQSNAILGIEYLKALRYYKSHMTPILIKRQGDNYRDLSIHSTYASASAIRKRLFDGNDRSFLYDVLPSPVSSFLVDQPQNSFARLDDYESFIRYAIKRHTPKSLAKIRGIREGLENKIIQCERDSKNLEEFFIKLKSKRYTMTSLTRISIQILLGIEHIQEEPNYIRVLGFSPRGQGLLKLMKTQSHREIITTLSKTTIAVKENPHMGLDILATDLYHLPNNGPSGLDYTTMPIMT